MKYAKICLLLVVIVFLTGCAHFQQNSIFKKYMPWQERQVELRQNKNWFISGSLSVTYNKKRDTVQFEWRQKQDNYVINISGPMNLNEVKIIGNTVKVGLCQPDNKCVWAKSLEKLLLNRFGWKKLPISNIRYWMLALPAPTKIEAINFDQYGNLIKIEQQGWKISYSEFQSIKNINLPNKIELQNGDFFIKLKITKRNFFNPHTSPNLKFKLG